MQKLLHCFKGHILECPHTRLKLSARNSNMRLRIKSLLVNNFDRVKNNNDILPFPFINKFFRMIPKGTPENFRGGVDVVPWE